VAFDLRKLVKDKRVLAAAGAGGGLGLLVYLKRRKAGAASGGGGGADATGQTIAPATLGNAGVDAYNNLQSGLEDLQGQINALGVTNAQQAVSPTSPAAQVQAATKYSTRRIGQVGKTYSLRSIAQRFAPIPGSANSVEAELRALVALNPGLRGRTALPGGYALKVPIR
jgi:hypothetical protein